MLATPRASLHLAEAEASLRRLPAESVHAVVTDPPYGLSASVDVEQMLKGQPQRRVEGQRVTRAAKAMSGSVGVRPASE